MKSKKILSGVLASALLVSAMPSFAAFADDDPTGNTMLTAVDVKFGELISEALPSSDHDWYKFTLPSAGKVTITVGSSNNANYSFLSVDDEATELESDVTVYGDKFFTYYLTAGDYYIELKCKEIRSCTYDMQVKFTPSDVTFDSADNNTIGKAVAVEYDGTAYNGQLSLNDSVDYYTFDVAEKGRVTLKFDSPMEKADWEIYDSEDAQIKRGTFTKKTNDSGISAKEANIMKPGKYTIAIKNNGDSYGNYSFSLDYLQNYNDISVSGIIAAADLNEDGTIDSSDASLILAYYAYLQTGGTETDMNKWLANK